MTLVQSPISLLAILQLVLDVALLAALVVLYRRLSCISEAQWERMAQATREALRLSKELEENLAEKRRLVERLEKAAEGLRAGAPPAGGDPAQQARRLLKGGLSREEVAEQTGLPLEEIELLASMEGEGGWRA